MLQCHGETTHFSRDKIVFLQEPTNLQNPKVAWFALCVMSSLCVYSLHGLGEAFWTQFSGRGKLVTQEKESNVCYYLYNSVSVSILSQSGYLFNIFLQSLQFKVKLHKTSNNLLTSLLFHPFPFGPFVFTHSQVPLKFFVDLILISQITFLTSFHALPPLYTPLKGVTCHFLFINSYILIRPA